MTTIVPLSRGEVTTIDDIDAEAVSRHKWSCQVFKRGKKYAVTTIDGKIVYMHRWLLDMPPGIEVDHKDGNSLNNRRSNLRKATHAQNLQNRPVSRANTTGYKGVSRNHSQTRFQATIMAAGKNYYLGTFDTPEEAAHAYDKAAQEHFGEFAWLNFSNCSE